VASARNPVTGDVEQFVGVNFCSKYDGEGIVQHGRPKLTLVASLDVSSSMGGAFQGSATNESKLKVAKDCLLYILNNLLTHEDSFGLVIFNHEATVVQPLLPLAQLDIRKLCGSIEKLRPSGGTDLTRGLAKATELYAQAVEDPSASRRVLYLTDLEANGGDDAGRFTAKVAENATASLWTTVVGLDMDLTINTIQAISKTPGANYSNVRTTEGFKDLMEREFAYLVTPIAFNIEVALDAPGRLIVEGFGSPEITAVQPGQRLKLSTEFPSLLNARGEKKPGPYLFLVRSTPEAAPLFNVMVEHEDALGITHTLTKEVNIPAEADPAVPYFQDDGIRKALLLLHYTQVVRRYETLAGGQPDAAFRTLLTDFCGHYAAEMGHLGDASLQEELDALTQVRQFLYPEPVGA